MNNHIVAYADRDIASRERQEDYAKTELIVTPYGLELQLALVCDGVGGENRGEVASGMAAEAIFDFIRDYRGNALVPDILREAVEVANRRVYSTLRGQGSTTVALAAVHLNDPELVNRSDARGRLYVASVGDSIVCVIRNGKMLRMNTDHTRANDMLLRGEISVDQVPYVENGEHLTRVVGYHEQVEVDIGFYASPDGGIIRPDVAEKLGRKGMLILPDDTIFATSDGMFKINPETRQPFVREEDFVHHALDVDVDKATRNLITYGSQRMASDNISLAMIFVDGPNRKENQPPVIKQPGLSPRLIATGVGILTFLVILLIGGGAVLFSLSGRNAELQETQVAQRAIAEEREARETRQALLPTEPPTETPLPPTDIPTSTPLPTPTERPVLDANAVAVQFVVGGGSQALFPNSDVAAANGQFVSVSGANTNADQDITNAALFFPDNNNTSRLTLENVNQNSFQAALDTTSDFFVRSGRYAVGGVTLVTTNANVRFVANSPCLSTRYISANTVVFSCYSDLNDDCSYELERNTPITIPGNTSVVVNVDTQQLVSGPTLISEDLDRFNETLAYFEAIQAISSVDEIMCIQKVVDPDLDLFVGADDLCPEVRGEFEGCGDTDGDTVHDGIDECPTQRGFVSTNGCPLPNVDGDPLPDRSDRCPNEFGSREFGGCPNIDDDGLADIDDGCPREAGPISNNGCPVPVEPGS